MKLAKQILGLTISGLLSLAGSYAAGYRQATETYSQQLITKEQELRQTTSNYELAIKELNKRAETKDTLLLQLISQHTKEQEASTQACLDSLTRLEVYCTQDTTSLLDRNCVTAHTYNQETFLYEYLPFQTPTRQIISARAIRTALEEGEKKFTSRPIHTNQLEEIE